MKNREVIEAIKAHHFREWAGGAIEEGKTRDKVLFGYPDDECTGIVTTIYASVDVIRKAIELGCNLIIAHEALFWNHGDHTDWLQNDQTYQMKKKLMEDHRITVWRDHDHIHAGVSFLTRRMDGIFYGLSKELGWEDYYPKSYADSKIYVIPRMKTMDLVHHINKSLKLDGMKIIGDVDGYSERIMIPGHIMGNDNNVITQVEEQNIDTLLGLEVIDYTAGIYINDSAQLGRNRRILVLGHFNLEEPGMKWFGEVYMPTYIKDIPIHFVQGGNFYKFVTEK